MVWWKMKEKKSGFIEYAKDVAISGRPIFFDRNKGGYIVFTQTSGWVEVTGDELEEILSVVDPIDAKNIRANLG